MNGRLWSPEEIDLVFYCYEFTPTRELAEMLGRTMSSVYQLARKLDLSKDPECVREQARAISARPDHGGAKHRFQKGQAPPNKGKKMPKGWAPGRMRETQFKVGEGHKHFNYMPIGATRKIDGYLYRKVSDIRNVPHTRNWKLEHYLLWEKKRGPVPAGHAVVFRDGNRENIRLSNLELITRAELMRRNTIHNLPKGLVQVIMLNGALKRKIRGRLRRAEEQDERPERPPVRNPRRAA